MRLLECTRPRVQDIDFAQGLIVVRDDKGQKDGGRGNLFVQP